MDASSATEKKCASCANKAAVHERCVAWGRESTWTRGDKSQTFKDAASIWDISLCNDCLTTRHVQTESRGLSEAWSAMGLVIGFSGLALTYLYEVAKEGPSPDAQSKLAGMVCMGVTIAAPVVGPAVGVWSAKIYRRVRRACTRASADLSQNEVGNAVMEQARQIRKQKEKEPSAFEESEERWPDYKLPTERLATEVGGAVGGHARARSELKLLGVAQDRPSLLGLVAEEWRPEVERALRES